MAELNRTLDIARVPVILLAGGESSRLGMPKGLFPLKSGETWLEWQIKNIKAAGIKKIILVLGFDSEKYLNATFSGGLSLRTSDPQVAVNLEPKRGPFSSLQTGAKLALLKPHPGFFVLPIDVPCPSPTVWQKFVSKYSEAYSAMTPTFQEAAGHPVFISQSLMQQLIMLPSTERLDESLRKVSREKIEVDDPKVLMNLNEESDFRKFEADGQL